MRISDWSSDVCSSDLWAWHSYRGVDERPQGFHADQAWLSGPLSSAHANLTKDCQSCHVEPFVAVTDTACVGCHNGEHKAMSQAHANAPTAMLLAARAPPGLDGTVLARSEERRGGKVGVSTCKSRMSPDR